MVQHRRTIVYLIWAVFRAAALKPRGSVLIDGDRIQAAAQAYLYGYPPIYSLNEVGRSSLATAGGRRSLANLERTIGAMERIAEQPRPSMRPLAREMARRE